MKNWRAYRLLRIKTGGMECNVLDDDVPEIIVSSLKQAGENINDYHNRNSDLLCTFNSVMKVSKW